MKYKQLVVLFAGVALQVHAQTAPKIRQPDGILNAASFAGPGMPNSSIAQGSIFNVFGTGLGPATLVQSSGFPVPTTLAATSLSVTSGNVTVKPYLLYTSAGQLAAVLPSSTPTGTASLTVTYNGQTSVAVMFNITASSFGVFTINSGGTGPGIVTDASVKVNGIDTLVTPSTSMKPGDVGIIWGTGIGPVTGDEGGSALPQDLTQIPVEVFIGGKPAVLTYRGRSGCCSGLDQVAFVVPSGVEGCNVPLSVKIGSTLSNFPSIAISSKGPACTDPVGLSAADQQKLLVSGNVSVGSITLTRANITAALPAPFPSLTNTSDIGAGLFEKFTYAQYSLFQNPTNFSIAGACTVFDYVGNTATYIDAQQPALLDAGDLLTVTGPNGVKTLVKGSATGLQYSRTLGNITAGLPGGTPLYLDKGSYSIVGGGGSGVGSFTANVALPDPLVWTNQAAIATVDRTAGQTVTWTGGDASGSVLILGFSTVTGANRGREFVCNSPAAAGTFTVPPSVLLALPPNTITVITSAASVTGALGVGFSKSTPFTAPNIDLGTVVGLNLNLKALNYR